MKTLQTFSICFFIVSGFIFLFQIIEQENREMFKFSAAQELEHCKSIVNN